IDRADLEGTMRSWLERLVPRQKRLQPLSARILACHLEDLVGDRRADVHARAASRLHIALAGELLIGQRHGNPRDAELMRQSPRRRHARSLAEPAGQDELSDLADDLMLERLAVQAIDAQGGDRGAGTSGIV